MRAHLALITLLCLSVCACGLHLHATRGRAHQAKNSRGADRFICEPPLFVVSVDPRVSFATEDAVDVWNRILWAHGNSVGERVLFLYGGEDRSFPAREITDVFVTVSVEEIPPERNESLNLDVAYAGRTWSKVDSNGCVLGARVVVDPDYVSDPDRLRTTLRHELGHVLGLEDSMDPSDVMHHYGSQWQNMHPTPPSEDERALVNRIYDRVEFINEIDLEREGF
jgi:hypothetical protein